jgi:methylmalonyl-CoA/ethylmalonyl-CoA epimerase
MEISARELTATRNGMGRDMQDRFSLHHVGIIVHDMDAAVERYRQLGFGEPERSTIEEQQVTIATFTAGSGYVELVSPIVEEGGLVRYLESRGESVHHVAYRVDDIRRELRRLADEGVELIDEEPRLGVHNWQVAFIHPKSCHGVLTELVQEPAE